MFVSVPIWTYVHPMCAVTPEARRGLELQAVVSCLIWVLKTKARSPARAANSLNLWAVLHPCLHFIRQHNYIGRLSQREWEGIPHCKWGLSLLLLHLESSSVLFREVENAYIPFTITCSGHGEMRQACWFPCCLYCMELRMVSVSIKDFQGRNVLTEGGLWERHLVCNILFPRANMSEAHTEAVAITWCLISQCFHVYTFFYFLNLKLLGLILEFNFIVL